MSETREPPDVSRETSSGSERLDTPIATAAEGIPAGGGEAAALARLEELLARVEVLAAQQRAGVLARRGSTEQRAVVRHALQSQLLQYLSAVGRVAARSAA